MIPNAITALALCFGLTGVSLAIRGEWERPLAHRACRSARWDRRAHRPLASRAEQVRRRARLIERQYRLRHRAALILFLWSLQTAPRSGGSPRSRSRSAARLRLARFNARLDAAEQPHKSAGFNTGVPAPAGAGLAFVPIFLWLVTGNAWFRRWELVMPWAVRRPADDFEHSDLQLVEHPIRRDWRLFALGGSRTARGGADRRAVGDPACPGDALPGDDSVSRASYAGSSGGADAAGAHRLSTRARAQCAPAVGRADARCSPLRAAATWRRFPQEPRRPQPRAATKWRGRGGCPRKLRSSRSIFLGAASSSRIFSNSFLSLLEKAQCSLFVLTCQAGNSRREPSP